ncbi:MAG: thiamine phosphate synthase [Syntrophobacteraceae bacterium]|nr:thiamine phosphate synthase [Syntrophobacteraceae bacterium]
MSRPALWPLDPPLYVVTDSRWLEGRSLEETVAAAIRGGAGVIQYREKNASTRRMVEEASRLCRLCRQEGAVFLVNDRLDVALAVNAHGIHVGREDMPVAVARRILGPGKIVGVSIHDEEEALRAEKDGADYLSVSPVYATSTKPDHETPLGIEGTRKLVQKTGLPVVAIGGIDESNLAGLIECGIRGICVVSAVMAAPDPEKKARSLAMRIRQAVESLRGG